MPTVIGYYRKMYGNVVAQMACKLHFVPTKRFLSFDFRLFVSFLHVLDYSTMCMSRALLNTAQCNVYTHNFTGGS